MMRSERPCFRCYNFAEIDVATLLIMLRSSGTGTRFMEDAMRFASELHGPDSLQDGRGGFQHLRIPTCVAFEA